MNTMNSIVWMLPIIFMIHDFEEIIMSEAWGKRCKRTIDKIWPKMQPFGLKYIHVCQTPTFAIGVEINFVLFSLISFFSVMFQNYLLWFVAFSAITLHMILLHMIMCIHFKGYVPGVITSVIFVLPSIWFLFKAETILHYSIGSILFACLIAVILTVIMVTTLHKFMGCLSKLIYKYSEAKEKL